MARQLIGHVKGDPGKFASVDVTVDDATGVPSCDASVSGESAEQTLTLSFHNLKGADGSAGKPGVTDVVTAEAAGLCPQLPGSADQVLLGDGSWGEYAGGIDVTFASDSEVSAAYSQYVKWGE